MAAQKLTEHQRSRIVELKLQRVPDNKIVSEVAVTTSTIHRCWTEHLATKLNAALCNTQHAQTETLQRLEQIATDARHGALLARAKNDHSAVRGYLDLERRTLDSITQVLIHIQEGNRGNQHSALDELAGKRADRFAASGVPAPPRRQARQRRA